MKKLLLIILMVLISQTAYSADEWDKTKFADDTLIPLAPALMRANNEALDRLLADRQTVRLEYSSGSTLVVTAGSVTCSNADGTVRKLRRNPSSTNVTFSDLDTGTEGSSTNYYVHANCDADSENFTVKISASATSPTGITSFKKLGSFLNDSSSNITTLDTESEKTNISTRESKTINVTYQALQDGYFVGLIVWDGSNATGNWTAALTGYSDNASSPTTIMGYAGIGSRAEGTAAGRTSANSFTIPVKQGDYYKATVSGSAYTTTLYWIPLR